MLLYLSVQKNLTVMLTSCSYLDNVDVEKYVESMLNIDFPFTNPKFPYNRTMPWYSLQYMPGMHHRYCIPI